MTRIIVVGDSLAGKSTMFRAVTLGQVPHNVFRSTTVEQFVPVPHAHFVVLPGHACDTQLRELADGADAVVVVYHVQAGVRSASKWLLRLAAVVHNLYRVPLLICCFGGRRASGSVLQSLLCRYPRAEHVDICMDRISGIADSVNRIVYRVRRECPSPLAAVRQLTGSC